MPISFFGKNPSKIVRSGRLGHPGGNRLVTSTPALRAFAGGAVVPFPPASRRGGNALSRSADRFLHAKFFSKRSRGLNMFFIVRKLRPSFCIPITGRPGRVAGKVLLSDTL